MNPPVACSGAPRDLGLDQGTALRAEIRAEIERLPWRARIEAALGGIGADRLCAEVDRDLRRYYPHMAERLDGLARGAGTRPGELSALLARELGVPQAPGPAASDAQLAALVPPEGPVVLGRSLPGAGAVWRTSAPDHDYASRELALPWLVPALGGRNSEGLCVLGAALPSAELGASPCAAPALLLVQDCLQRFDTTQKAIEWCEGRPAGGRASLVIADAYGDVAEIEIAGADRQVRRPADGVVVSGADPAEAQKLRKRIAEAPSRGEAELRKALEADGGRAEVWVAGA